MAAAPSRMVRKEELEIFHDLVQQGERFAGLCLAIPRGSPEILRVVDDRRRDRPAPSLAKLRPLVIAE